MSKMAFVGGAVVAVAALIATGYGVFTITQPATGQQDTGMMGGGMMGPGMMGPGMMAQPKDEPADATGETIFHDNCAACHAIAAGAGSGIGPNLHGLFGRRSGSLQGYDYSTVLIAAGIVWNDKMLDEYIADPAAVVPGNKMGFAGIKDARHRRALIAYLKEATK